MINNIILIGVFQVCTVLLSTSSAHAQDADSSTIDKASLVGIWEVEGAIMGEGGEGWVMPHKQSAPDCGKDHTVLEEDNTAKEVKYTEGCEAKTSSFEWKLQNDNTLSLTKGERTIKWHIIHLDENTMRVGVQLRPDSEHKMYVAYKRQ